MCGRFASPSSEDLKKFFNIDAGNFFDRRYNAAPSLNLPVIVSEEGQWIVQLFRWGLIPSWAKDEKMGYRCINARYETAHEKPAFRKAFSNQRCLVPALGFYEWKSEASIKQPYFIKNKNNECSVFAGLYDVWVDPASGKNVRSFSILTTQADKQLQNLHTRMPVILSSLQQHEWIKGEELSLPSGIALEFYPVSRKVNNPRHESPELLEALTLDSSEKH